MRLSKYLPTLPETHNIAVFVGAMARGKDDFADGVVDEKISISDYPLSASVACGKVSTLGDHGDVRWGTDSQIAVLLCTGRALGHCLKLVRCSPLAQADVCRFSARLAAFFLFYSHLGKLKSADLVHLIISVAHLLLTTTAFQPARNNCIPPLPSPFPRSHPESPETPASIHPPFSCSCRTQSRTRPD